MVKLANGKKRKGAAPKRAPKPQRNTPNRPKKPANSKETAVISAYRAALTRPFSPQAAGARVLDLYSTPTVTRAIKRNFKISSDANGECDIIFLPHPGTPLYSSRGSIADGITFTLGETAAVTIPKGQVQDIMSSISSELAAFRVVGCGIRVTAICANTVEQGLTITGTVPYSGATPGQYYVGGQLDNAGSAATFGDWLSDNGIPQNSNKVDLTQTANMSRSVTSTTQTLDTTALIAVPRVTSPAAFLWKRTKDSAFGYQTQDQTSVSYVASGDASYMDASGFEAVVFGATGLPATTTVFSVETIFHLEGPARLSNSVFNAEGNTPSPVHWDGFVSAISAAASSPAVQLIATSAANSLKSSLAALLL